VSFATLKNPFKNFRIQIQKRKTSNIIWHLSCRKTHLR